MSNKSSSTPSSSLSSPGKADSTAQHTQLQMQEDSVRSQNQGMVTRSDPLPKWYPKFRGRPLYNGNREALGWALDGIGRATQFICAGAFLGTAILRIAKEAAGCPTEPLPGETTMPDCDKRVYGIKPSSLLTTYTMIVGIASAALLPLMGAILDYTPYRLKLGRFMSALFTILICPTIFLNEQNFFAIAMIQVVLSFLGWAQTSITYSYLPELTEDQNLLNDYTKSFTVSSFAAMVIFLGVVIGSVSIFGSSEDDDDDSSDLLTSQVGMSLAFLMNVFLLSFSWGWLFQPREALHSEIPEGHSLWSIGFVQLYQTSRHIANKYRALKWFYLSISMSEAGLQALATIAITYITDKLMFTATESGIAMLLMLLGCVPGAMIANVVTRKTNPLTSSQISLGLLILTTALFATLLTGPNQQLETYIIGFVWGIATGWKWTVDRLVASSIIPPNQDAELMGVFLFSGQALTWLPPLVYTTINEAGISQRVGVGTLDAFFLLALIFYCFMGGYEQALREVADTAKTSNDDHPKSLAETTTTTVPQSEAAAANNV